MTRTIDINSNRAYRVLMTFKSHDDSIRTQVYGPYSTESAAKGVLTRETNGYYNRRKPLDAWIEATPEGWERIEL